MYIIVDALKNKIVGPVDYSFENPGFLTLQDAKDFLFECDVEVSLNCMILEINDIYTINIEFQKLKDDEF